MGSLILIGIFYVFTSYASAIGWGTSNMAAFASNPNPYYLLGHTLWGPAGGSSSSRSSTAPSASAWLALTRRPA